MMAAQQAFPPGMGPGHPGMAGPGHPMAAMQHPGGHMGGHPPGMMQGMHPGVSGPQVTQGPMVTGMPQGPGTPAPGHMPGNSVAMAHLGPQQHMFQQQGPQMNFAQMNPGAQQQFQHNAIMRQRMMQQMQQQQQQGMPMNMANNPNFSQAQLAQMKMNMPMQQQMAAHMQNPQMQQFRNQQHQQQLIAAHQQQQQQQQALAQQQRHAAQAQAMQMSRSQGEQQQAQAAAAAAAAQAQQTTQPPQPHPTPAPQTQPQSQPTPQPQPTPTQTPVPQNKAPPQAPTAANQQTPQQAPPQNQNTPQVKQGEGEEEVQIKQQDPATALGMADIPKNALLDSGQCILQLIMFQDSLASPQRPDDINWWHDIVNKYFSPDGQLKMQLFNAKNHSDKSYLLHAASLARFYHAHFVAGIKQIQLTSFDHIQRTVNGQTSVQCSSASLMYVFADDIRVSTSASMLALFDEFNRIVRLDIMTGDWQEFIPRQLAIQAIMAQRSPQQNVKQSPKASNKNLKKVQQQEQTESPEASLASSNVCDWGIPMHVMKFLEISEVCRNMQPLMEYFHGHPGTSPFQALQNMNKEGAQQMQARMQNQVARQANGQMQFPQQGGMNGPTQFSSPGMAHLGLPQSQGSPHLGGPVHTPSPAQNVQGGVPMMHQMSAQGSNLSGSQGPSTNTSPNVSNKRRRPSTVKVEDDNASANQDGNQSKVKPSPRIGGKRQKAS